MLHLSAMTHPPLKLGDPLNPLHPLLGSIPAGQMVSAPHSGHQRAERAKPREQGSLDETFHSTDPDPSSRRPPLSVQACLCPTDGRPEDEDHVYKLLTRGKIALGGF